MRKSSIIYFLLILLSSASVLKSQNNYFLCAYMDGKAQDLRYCISADGYHFRPVNSGKTILKSTIGGKILRDPQILKDKKGVYHLIATNAWYSRDFAIWDSKDLVHWNNERLITISPQNADKTWAPEAIYNEKDKNYLFYWTSSLGKDSTTWSIYYATTKDFKNFSQPVILFKSDAIILDANIVESYGRYYMFYRYKKQIWRREASELIGNYINPNLIIDANVEGPYVYKVADNKWNMFFDYYTKSGYYGMVESENLTDWKWLTSQKFPYNNEIVSFPVGVRHGSIIKITAKQYKKLNY
jgi:hypothetical protein